MKKIALPLIVPLLLSLVLHTVLIAGASVLRVFDFRAVLTAMPISAFLVSENIAGSSIKPEKISGSSTTNKKDRPAYKSSGRSKHPTSIQNEKPEEQHVEKVIQPVDSLQPFTIPGTSQSPVSPPKKLTDFAGVPAALDDNAAPGPQTDLASAPAQPQPDQIQKRNLLPGKKMEKLSYSIYWMDVYVGMAMLEASRRNDRLTIKSQVHSAPFISVFYKVEDYAESTVVAGSAAMFRIKQHEGRYRSDKETVFDALKKQVTFTNYIKGTTDGHAIDTPEVWDLISGFYYLRTLLIEVGKTLYIDVFDSNKFFRTEVSVLGKERIRLSNNSQVDTIKVKPVIKSEGLFQKSGDVIIWLTDDENRTPVKVETKVPIGKVMAVLTSKETE